MRFTPMENRLWLCQSGLLGKAESLRGGLQMRKVIGKGGSVIDRIEKTLGLHVDVREMEAEAPRGERGRRHAAESRAPQQKARLSVVDEGVVTSSVHPLTEINKKHLILSLIHISEPTRRTPI